MKINQLITEMEKELDIKDYIEILSRQDGAGYIFDSPKFKSFISSYTRKLIEAVAEELMSVKLPRIEDDYSPFTKGIEQGFNAVMAKQRLKVKEILEVIK